MSESLRTIGGLDDAQDNWMWQRGGDRMQVYFRILMYCIKNDLVTLNEDSCDSKILVMFSLIAAFPRGSSADPPSWKKSESRGYSMLSQCVFVLEEVIYISEKLWTLFPGINAQHM